MDPSAADKKKKDGDWNFPPEVEFPVDARVLLKFYKVVGMGETSDDGKGVQTKYINTKVMKVETSLNQEDLYTKSSLVSAIERDCDLRRVSSEESIQNPKFEISVKRQESGEIFTVTKMGLVVKRLEKLKDRSDTILVEVKEMIISFQPKQPTIKLIINGDPKASVGAFKGRRLGENVVKSLENALVKLGNSRYDKESKKIICGKCSLGVAPRAKGAAKTLVSYFADHHFDICGNKERKRKAKEELENSLKEKKQREVEKMDNFWKTLRSKSDQIEDQEIDDGDIMTDADLLTDEDLVDIVASAGAGTSSG